MSEHLDYVDITPQTQKLSPRLRLVGSILAHAFQTSVSPRGSAGAAALAAFTNDGVSRASPLPAARSIAAQPISPPTKTTGARSSRRFTLDRTIINLNNGGCCPSPRVVHEAFKRYLDISNQAPVYHMWQILEPNIETVRRRLAAEFGCRSGGDGHHAQRERGAADRAARLSI